MALITVLVTAVGSTTGVSVIKALRHQSELEVRIIGTDSGLRHEVAGAELVDRFVRVPLATSPGFVDQISSLAHEEGVAAVFPIVDTEVEVLAEHRTRLPTTVLASPAEVVRTCNDKLSTYGAFRANAIPTPQSWDAQQARAAAANLPYPLIVKPSRGVSSRDHWQVDDEVALFAALAKVNAPIVQELIVGPEYTVDVASDRQGTVLAAVPRVRTETKAGICVRGHTVNEPEVTMLARTVTTTLGVTGGANVQIMRGADGLSVIEINPRFAATMPLTVEAGVNGPLLLLKDLLGMDIRSTERTYETDVYVARYWQETFWRPQ